MVRSVVRSALPVLWILAFNAIGSMVGLLWGSTGLILGMTTGMMLGAATLPFAVLFARIPQTGRQSQTD